MTLTLRYAVRSDRGLVRSNNEDSVYAGPRLLAIADGMGGHAAGEVASNIVIGTLERLDEDRPVPDLIGALRSTVAEANAALADSVEANDELAGMGTTLTAIRFAETRIALVHVGDSRAYLLRSGQLSQITHDDTYVQSLVDSGQLTPEEASSHPRKSVILRALTGTDLEPDISIREAREGDRYLLCTDGLTDVVTSATLMDTLSQGTPQGCADRLVELALRGGGPDNVTCIVADVVDAAAGDDLPMIGGAVADPRHAVDTEIDSPSGRAARIGRVARPVEPAARTSRHLRRRLIGWAVAAVVVVGALTAGWFWTQTQYYVGRDGREVAIFEGLNLQFGPFSLHSVSDNTDLKMSDLTPAARSQVSSGIIANSHADAAVIVTRLRDTAMLPLCSSLVVPTPTSTPAVSTSPTATGTPHATTSAKSTAKSTAKASSTAKATSTARSTAKATARTTAPAASSAPSTPSVSDTPTPAPVLGPDVCRP